MNTIFLKSKDIQVNVSVYVYLDKDYPAADMYIAYCPSLNIVGYRHGEESAKKGFEYMLNEYISEQMQNRTLEKDLKNLGWKESDNAFDEPKVTEMATHNEILSDVLNAPVYSKINVSTTYQVFA